MNSTATLDHQVLSNAEWQRKSRDFLDKEKELTRMSDEVARQRRELPWTRVDKKYVFDGPQGERSLSDMFGDRNQLATYHFMFGPDWVEGCPGCSYVTDHLNGALEHLNARDVALVLVSRAPQEKLFAFKQRMGWKLPWYSSCKNDFNRDFGVYFTKEEVASGANAYNFSTVPPHGEENPGLSLFYKDGSGEIFHTYSTYGRGLDAFLGTYVVLDRSAKGRDEDDLSSPMSWLRHHDKYEQNLQSVGSCCQHKNGQ